MVFVVLKAFEGAFWRWIDGSEGGKDKVIQRSDVARGMILAVGGGVFAEQNIFVAMKLVFNRPVFAVVGQQVSGRGFVRRQAGNEPRHLKRRRESAENIVYQAGSL